MFQRKSGTEGKELVSTVGGALGVGSARGSSWLVAVAFPVQAEAGSSR
ncbi:hypothetical protein ACWCOZ_20565 [Streptomyces sp. NPDC001840]